MVELFKLSNYPPLNIFRVTVIDAMKSVRNARWIGVKGCISGLEVERKKMRAVMELAKGLEWLTGGAS